MTKKLVASTDEPSMEELYPVFASGPDAVENVVTSLAENLGGDKIGPNDLDRIKVPSGDVNFWLIPDLDDPDGKTAKEFEGIVVGQTMTRSYWEQDIDEGGSGSPPDCSSPDSIVGFGTPGGKCKECPLSQWGSDGGKGQACKSVRNMFVLLPGSALPIVLNIPPSSLQEAKRFLLRLGSRGRSLSTTAIRFGLVKTQSSEGVGFCKISFNVGQPVPASMTPAIKMYERSFGPNIK